MNAPQAPFVGQSVTRREDARFLTGRGQYTDDITLEGQTYGEFLRSPHAHARIKKLDTTADGKVRYVGDRVALVVAETREQAEAAVQMIDVDYDELPAVVDAAKAAKAGSAVHDEAPDNRCYQWGIGDKDGVDAALKGAAHV